MSITKWKSLQNLKDWYSLVDQFKLAFNFKSGNFFNYDNIENFKQAAIFFHKFMPDSPKDKSTVSCPLGNLQRRSLIIDPELFFGPTESMIRQGDLVFYSEGFNKFSGTSIKHVIVISHTCDVKNKIFSLIIPAYTKDEFLDLEKDKSDSFQDNARTNKVIHFIPYLPFANRDYEVVADLRQITTIHKDELSKGSIINSLSLQGLFYFQNRLALSQIRDLKDRDDLRILKK